MPLTLTAARVENLIVFVDRRVRAEGCDYTLRFAQAWARAESVDWDDLLDTLESHGGYCDCEVVLNVPTGGRSAKPAGRKTRRTEQRLAASA